ncbi:MAG: flagellar basal body P-ring formation protein FlgA, partial [Pseudomonadota bacterium]
QAIEAAAVKMGREIVVKRLNLGGDIQVAPGDAVAEAVPFTTRGAGRLGFTLKMRDDLGDTTSFNVEAFVDEWAEMPVAKRALPRGAVVSEEDVMMARLNISALPGDVAREHSRIVGLSIASDIAFGEVFRRNKLAIPAAVEANSRVTVIYRSPGFEATASGVALENGIVGQEIRIRNESSKKIISGTVVEPGLVRVKL